MVIKNSKKKIKTLKIKKNKTKKKLYLLKGGVTWGKGTSVLKSPSINNINLFIQRLHNSEALKRLKSLGSIKIPTPTINTPPELKPRTAKNIPAPPKAPLPPLPANSHYVNMTGFRPHRTQRFMSSKRKAPPPPPPKHP